MLDAKQKSLNTHTSNYINSPMRSLGASSPTEESDREKLRLKGVVVKLSLGVVVGVRLELCCSGTLMLSEFHLRCLFKGSTFPTAS